MAKAGFVVIHRSIFDHPALQDGEVFRAFCWLIAHAAWSPRRVTYKGHDAVLERGQLMVSVRDLARSLGKTPSWVQRFFARLEKAEIIVRKTDTPADTQPDTPSDTPPAVITICNYGKYQDLTRETDTPSDTPADTGTDTQKNKRTIITKENNPSVVSPSRKQATAWQDGRTAPDEYITWAVTELGWSRGQARTEAQRFIDSALAKRRTYVDWMAAWRQWCRSPFQKTVGQKQQALTL